MIANRCGDGLPGSFNTGIKSPYLRRCERRKASDNNSVIFWDNLQLVESMSYLYSSTLWKLWQRDNFRSDVQIQFRIQLLITMIRRLLRRCRIVQGGRLSLCLISKHFWIIQAGGCEKMKLWKVNTSQRLQDV